MNDFSGFNNYGTKLNKLNTDNRVECVQINRLYVESILPNFNLYPFLPFLNRSQMSKTLKNMCDLNVKMISIEFFRPLTIFQLDSVENMQIFTSFWTVKKCNILIAMDVSGENLILIFHNYNIFSFIARFKGSRYYYKLYQALIQSVFVLVLPPYITGTFKANSMIQIQEYKIHFSFLDTCLYICLVLFWWLLRSVINPNSKILILNFCDNLKFVKQYMMIFKISDLSVIAKQTPLHKTHYRLLF